MVDESRPELRFAPGDGGGRPIEFREPSTFNFDMASLRRLDMASELVSQREATAQGSKQTFFAKVGWRQYSGHRMILGHLLQDLDEEPDLHLGRLLQQGIQSGSALGLTQDTEPLLDGAQLILEILIQGGRRHLRQGGLVLVDIIDPLLRGPIQSIVHVPLTLGMLIEKYLRRRTHSISGGEGGREARHICGCPQLMGSA